MQKTLDMAIKKHEKGSVESGYFVNGKSYSSYMDNRDFDDFIVDMQKNCQSAFVEYGAGQGGELKEKRGFPPKMASYGSSSRMIYNLSRPVPDFHFEYKLPTTVGGTANLDGFLEKDDSFIFVEAKCREPYGAKKHFVESKYKNLYDYINSDKTCNLCIDTYDEKGKMGVTFSVGDKIVSVLDIKQMICHLLGIGTYLLRCPSDKKIRFLYLCFDPRSVDIDDARKKERICSVYDTLCRECTMIDFYSLFACILRYLREVLKVGNAAEAEVKRMTDNFSFLFCKPEDYLKHLK